MYKEEDFTGPKNGLQPTTWAFCWRCGKAISPHRKNESITGVHSKCDTYNGDKIELNFSNTQGITKEVVGCYRVTLTNDAAGVTQVVIDDMKTYSFMNATTRLFSLKMIVKDDMTAEDIIYHVLTNHARMKVKALDREFYNIHSSLRENADNFILQYQQQHSENL